MPADISGGKKCKVQQNKEKNSSNQATWGQLIEVHPPSENPEIFAEDFRYQIPWYHSTRIRFSQPVADDTGPIPWQEILPKSRKIPMEFLGLVWKDLELFLVGGCTIPFEKYLSNWIISPGRDEFFLK